MDVQIKLDVDSHKLKPENNFQTSFKLIGERGKMDINFELLRSIAYLKTFYLGSLKSYTPF